MPSPGGSRHGGRIVHVPMALSVQSSTLMTVVERVSEAWSALGGTSAAILSDNRSLMLPGGIDVTYVDYTRDCPREFFTRRELAVDVARGALGGLRPHYGHAYDAAVEAVLAEAADVVLLYEGHYASATLPQWRTVRATKELCLYVHNPLSRTYGRRELGRLLDGADRVIFCADHLRADAEHRLGRAEPRFEVVPNGVEPRFFASAPRERPDVFTVVLVGRIAPHKGMHLGLEAVAAMASKVAGPVRVEVVGSSSYGGGEPSDYESSLRASAAAMVAPVEFRGWLEPDELARSLADASVVCLPSLGAEGMPLVALEALASGTPVVCSDSPGLLEAVGDVGLVSPRGDVGGMADNLARLALDSDEWTARSAAGVERAAGFTWAEVAAKIGGLAWEHPRRASRGLG